MPSRKNWGVGVLLLCSSVIFSGDPALARGTRRAQAASSEQSQEKALEESQKHLEKARALREKGKNELAIAEYRKSIGADPGMVESYLELGELYSQTNAPGKAVEMLDLGIGMALGQEIGGPDIGRYCCLLAKNHQALGRIDLASGDLAKAQKYLPDDPLPLIALGDIQAGRGRFQEAIGAYRRALELDQRNPDCWWALGNVGIKARQPEIMQEAFQGLSSLAPDKASAFAELMKSAASAPPAGAGKEPTRP